MGTEHIVMFSKDRGQIWSEVADFCASCEEIYACYKMKWSLVTELIFMWNHLMWAFSHIQYEGFSDPQSGQSWTVKISHRKGSQKNHENWLKSIPPKKGGDGFQENAVLLGTNWGEKSQSVNLRVIKNSKRWKLRSMFTSGTSLCLKGDTSTNACFWIVMIVFGRVVSGWNQTLYEHCTPLQTKNNKTDICATYWYFPPKK